MSLRYLLAFLLLSLSPLANAATEDSVVARIVLIGDAGALTADGHHTVVEAVEKHEKLDKKTTVIYLGDNLYRHGLPHEQYPKYEAVRAVLDSQINIADHGPDMVYFIPGNHDWMNSNPGGYDAAIRQERYIESRGKKNLKFLPRNGCPGPEEIQLGNDMVLVIVNTQWWLHPQYKPGIESDCGTKTREELLSELEDIVTRNYRKLLIFAVHHPFKSNGVHGGYYTLKQHIFPFTDMKKNLYVPLPVLGSIYPISRSVFGTLEDLKFPDYANMITQMGEVLKAHPNVIHVSGHEHALQWLADSNINYIVSGAGCKTSRVSPSRKSKFHADALGWATLEVYKDKKVRCTFYGADHDSAGKVLFSDIAVDYSKYPLERTPDTSVPLAIYHDTALVPAGPQYAQANGLRRMLNGNNYRQEWETPVSLKVFHLQSTNGGYKVMGARGSSQSRMMHLVDAKGKRYNLRTIDRTLRPVLPEKSQETFARTVVRDLVSATHPYAPLSIPVLADAAGVIVPHPQYFFVPDDPVFGLYRPLFANRICLLEPENPTPDGLESRSSATVINSRISTDDHFVDQKAVLRARLLDMLVGDWDRHPDQWRWGVGDTGKGLLYYPIPRNRDQVFFNSTGLVMPIAARRRLPWMAGFKADLQHFKWLSYTARDFDRFFMNELGASDWKSAIDYFRHCESDSVIHYAVAAMPDTMVALRGELLEEKLRSRRDQIDRLGMRYYRFISRRVNVLGSNRPEVFTVRDADSGILVQVHAREHGADTNRLMYSRLFDPKVTKELRFWGFNGRDKFIVDEALRTRMQLRFIGGGGADTFDIAGRARTTIYDVTTEPNVVLRHKHTDNDFKSSPTVNDYKFQENNYNFLRFPTIALGYNNDDGPLTAIGIWRRSYGFRKEPYASDNKLTALAAFERRAFQLKYRGTFNHALKNFDLLLSADLHRPALRNFYGIGNETQAIEDQRFYRARYNLMNADVLLQKRFYVLRIAAGPEYNYYTSHEFQNDDRVLERPAVVGLDSVSIYGRKQYGGGKLLIEVNNLNSEIFPTRGICWHNELHVLKGLNSDTRPFTSATTDMDIYASLSDPARLVAVLRAGGGHIFSDDYEYFQAMSVGQNNYLRGFRRNRFAGRSMAYGSLELRGKLGEVKGGVIPGAFGLMAFTDAARVWADGENSRRWHNSVGGGAYFIPFNMFLISATTAVSPEETIFNISIGTKLNVIL
jgi:hypothetical protein